jgi:putative hydrolase of the HAD superfamily
MALEAILFDFGGTLDADGVPWKDRFRDLFLEEGVVLPPERFDRAFYDADDPLVDRADPEASYRDVVHELGLAVARTVAPEREGLGDRVADRFLRDSQATITRNIEVLEGLKPRFRLGIVSNFYGNLARACRETGLDRLLDVAVDSSVVGPTKPSPLLFGAALDALGIEPSSALMVGDSVRRDIEGARRTGLDWLLLLRADVAVEDAGVGPARVIRSLAEIEARIGGAEAGRRDA